MCSHALQLVEQVSVPDTFIVMCRISASLAIRLEMAGVPWHERPRDGTPRLHTPDEESFTWSAPSGPDFDDFPQTLLSAADIRSEIQAQFHRYPTRMSIQVESRPLLFKEDHGVWVRPRGRQLEEKSHFLYIFFTKAEKFRGLPAEQEELVQEALSRPCVRARCFKDERRKRSPEHALFIVLYPTRPEPGSTLARLHLRRNLVFFTSPA